MRGFEETFLDFTRLDRPQEIINQALVSIPIIIMIWLSLNDIISFIV
jgi:hypothetical protein